MKVTYQDIEVINYNFHRSAGLRADRGYVIVPASIEDLELQKKIEKSKSFVSTTKPYVIRGEIKDGFHKEVKVKIQVANYGNLIFDDGENEPVVFEDIYIGDNIKEKQIVYMNGTRINILQVDITDVRHLWNKQGFVQGEFNILAGEDDSRWAYTSNATAFRKGSVKTRKATRPPAYYGWTGTEIDADPYTLRELLEICISNLPTGYTSKNFDLAWGEGLTTKANPKDKLEKDILEKFGVMIDLDKSEPVDIKWLPAKLAVQALASLFKKYNITLALSPANEIVIHKVNFGVDFEKQISPLPEQGKIRYIERNIGKTFKHAPLSITVIGGKTRHETMVSSWFPVLPWPNGSYKPLKDVIEKWGLTFEYVANQVILVEDEGNRFKNHPGNLGVAPTPAKSGLNLTTFFTPQVPTQEESKIEEEARAELLSKHALRMFMVGEGERWKLPLLPLLDLTVNQPGTKREKGFSVSGFFIKKKDSKQPDGHFQVKYYKNAIDKIASIDGKLGVIKLQTPAGIGVPLSKVEGYQYSRIFAETQKLEKIRLHQLSFREDDIAELKEAIDKYNKLLEKYNKEQAQLEAWFSELSENQLFMQYYEYGEKKYHRKAGRHPQMGEMKKFSDDLIGAISRHKLLQIRSLFGEWRGIRRFPDKLTKIVLDFLKTMRTKTYKGTQWEGTGKMPTPDVAEAVYLYFQIMRNRFALDKAYIQALNGALNDEIEKAEEKNARLSKNFQVLHTNLERFVQIPIHLHCSYEAKTHTAGDYFSFSFGVARAKSHLIVDNKIKLYYSLAPRKTPKVKLGSVPRGYDYIARLNREEIIWTASKLVEAMPKYTDIDGTFFGNDYFQFVDNKLVFNKTKTMSINSNEEECAYAALIRCMEELKEFFPMVVKTENLTLAGWHNVFTDGRINSMELVYDGGIALTKLLVNSPRGDVYSSKMIEIQPVPQPTLDVTE